MPTIKVGGALMLAIATIALVVSLARAAESPPSEAQLVEIAIEANPQLRSACYRWDSDQAPIKIQTAAAVATLFRSAQLAYSTAILYRDSVPLARQDLRLALTAYQSGKIDFVTLSSALQCEYAARVSYLQAANQFLAGKVSLEQAIEAPLHQ